jgi:hypothetical protein
MKRKATIDAAWKRLNPLTDQWFISLTMNHGDVPGYKVEPKYPSQWPEKYQSWLKVDRTLPYVKNTAESLIHAAKHIEKFNHVRDMWKELERVARGGF